MATAAQRQAAANARASIGNQAALVKGSAAAKARMAALRAMRGTAGVKKVSARGAKVAFNRYYRNKAYSSPRRRQAAITRDLCSGNKPVTTGRRYLRSPHRYDYPGLDDGSQCPSGNARMGKRPQTAAQKRAGVAKGSAAAKARMAAVRAARR